LPTYYAAVRAELRNPNTIVLHILTWYNCIIASRILAIETIKLTYLLTNPNPAPNLTLFKLKIGPPVTPAVPALGNVYTDSGVGLFVFELGPVRDGQTDGRAGKTRNAAYWDSGVTR